MVTNHATKTSKTSNRTTNAEHLTIVDTVLLNVSIFRLDVPCSEQYHCVRQSYTGIQSCMVSPHCLVATWLASMCCCTWWSTTFLSLGISSTVVLHSPWPHRRLRGHQRQLKPFREHVKVAFLPDSTFPVVTLELQSTPCPACQWNHHSEVQNATLPDILRLQRLYLYFS